MTREEVIEELSNYETEYGFHPNDVYAVVNKVYDDFEQQLKEANAYKTCDGCKYDNDGYCTKYYNDKYERVDCSRLTEDRYEPKD